MPAFNESGTQHRVATLNIRHGGKKHSAALAARLLGYDADVLVVTEFRPDDAGAGLISRLEGGGYAMSHPGGESGRNTILVASRTPIVRAWALDGTLDAERLRCVDTGTAVSSNGSRGKVAALENT